MENSGRREFNVQDILDSGNYIHWIEGIDWRNDASSQIMVGANVKQCDPVFSIFLEGGKLRNKIIEELERDNKYLLPYKGRTARLGLVLDGKDALGGFSMAFGDRDRCGRYWPTVYVIAGRFNDELYGFLEKNPEMMIEVFKKSQISYDLVRSNEIFERRFQSVELDREFRRFEEYSPGYSGWCVVVNNTPLRVPVAEAPKKSLLKRLFSKK